MLISVSSFKVIFSHLEPKRRCAYLLYSCTVQLPHLQKTLSVREHGVSLKKQVRALKRPRVHCQVPRVHCKARVHCQVPRAHYKVPRSKHIRRQACKVYARTDSSAKWRAKFSRVRVQCAKFQRARAQRAESQCERVQAPSGAQTHEVNKLKRSHARRVTTCTKFSTVRCTSSRAPAHLTLCARSNTG